MKKYLVLVLILALAGVAWANPFGGPISGGGASLTTGSVTSDHILDGSIVNADFDFTGYNFIVGTGAADNITGTARYNIVFGRDAMAGNLTGDNNFVAGESALRYGTAPAMNVAISQEALRDFQGEKSVCIGFECALEFETGIIAAVGAGIGPAFISGTDDTGVGYGAFPQKVSGDNTSVFGAQSGTGDIYGSGNTWVGAYSGPTTDNQTNASAFGYGAQTTADNQVSLGDNNVTSFRFGGTELSRTELAALDNVSSSIQTQLDGKQATIGDNTLSGTKILDNTISSDKLNFSAGTGDVVGPASATADALVLFNGTGGKTIKDSTYTITAAGAALLDDAAASNQRTTLGLGTIATQASDNVAITGGSVTGITDITVADGGTGRSTGTTAYALIATGTTATGAQQSLAAGATTEILVGGGDSALPVWVTATGTGAPVRAGSPTFTGTVTAPKVVVAGTGGGTIDNTVIGGTTPVAGTFTTLTYATAVSSAADNTHYWNVMNTSVDGSILVAGNCWYLKGATSATDLLQCRNSDNTATNNMGYVVKTFSFGIDNVVVATDNILLWRVPRAITLTQANCYASTDNVVGSLMECATDNVSSCTVLDSWTVTNSVDDYTDTSFTDAAVAAGAWVRWSTTSVGTSNSNKLSCTIQYRE